MKPRRLLDDLTVADKHDDGGYEYPDTWKSASRYGEDAKINDNCQPYYGSWTDPRPKTG